MPRLNGCRPWLLLPLATFGCVHTYQPVSNLHRPVVIDHRENNFADVRLDLHCVPGDLLTRYGARKLCERVATLFERQGAVVVVHLSEGEDAEDLEATEAPPHDPSRRSLSMALKAHKIHRDNHPISWIACIGTLTLVPGLQELTFEQEVVIRDGTGFLLLTDSLQGRIVDRFGFGAWAGNGLMDWLWRDEEDEILGAAINHDLSRDLYRQLSQSLFNANMRAQVLVPVGAVVEESG